MASCAEAILSSRMQLTVAKERSYGVDPGGGVDLPVYSDPADPIDPTFRYHDRRPSDSNLRLSPSRVSASEYRLPSIETRLFDDIDTAPQGTWLTLLEACGFQPREDLSTSTRKVWRLGALVRDSAVVRVNLDGVHHDVLGVRGSTSMEGVAGEDIVIRFEGRGRFGPPIQQALDTRKAGVLKPRKFCSAAFTIRPLGMDDIVGEIKGFSIAANTILVERRPSGHGVEFRQGGMDPRWSCEVEVDRRYDFSKMRSEDRLFKLSMNLGSGPGDIWEVYTPEYGAFIADDPRYRKGDESGVRTVNLVFGLAGRDDRLELVRRL